jgi:hypothetical protein
MRVMLSVLCLIAVSGSLLAQDPTGTVQATQVSCPSKMPIKGQISCYSATVSCPNMPKVNASVRILAQTGTQVGAVIYGTGGTGSVFFDLHAYGATAMETLASDGYLGVEYAWPSQGWQDNANGLGVRAAACRYATLVQWVWQAFAAGAPLCTTGNSAGSFQIGAALAHYGSSAYIRDAELTSGPPFTRVDYACINNQREAISPCSAQKHGLGVVPATSAQFIDPAYPDNRCSSAYTTHDRTHEQEFLDDSVTSPDAALLYPGTSVYFIFGGLDASAAIRQGMLYQAQLRTSGTVTGTACVADAPHEMASVADGAAAIVSGILNHCK